MFKIKSELKRKEMKKFVRSLLILLGVLSFSNAVFAASSNLNEAGRKKVDDENKQIVVAVTRGRIRSEPNLQSEILKESTIGIRFIVVEEKDGWSRVQLSEPKEGEEAETGWISKTITVNYDSSRPGVLYQQIVEKYFKRKNLSFTTASEIFDFLPRAADEAKTFEVGGDLRLKHLKMLALALKVIPFGKEANSPYKEFLEKYKGDVIYSEPAGQWYVRSEKFWQLHERYKKHKIGEEIAWYAAGNPTPGECEGYINCYLYLLRITQGEYLNFYPNGSHSKGALQDIYSLLQPIVEDLPAKSVYYTASDISDRAEFNTMLAELRKIISKSPHLEKTKILTQISQIAEGHR